MRFAVTFPLLVAAAAAPAPLSAQTAAAVAVAKAAATIRPADVARHVARLAADSLLGRETPSPGLETTARYVAGQFRRFGLTPGGDNGTWLQRYPLPQAQAQDSNALAPETRTAPKSRTAPNTIGLLEGRDPVLKKEYIVLLAHMDGIGVNSGRFVDSIYNGADDNASGTAGLLELAEAFSRPGARPRRSLLFLAVSGQEQTFLGSRAFLTHAPVPPGQIAAVINLDMIGRNWRDQILAVGAAHSTIGATLAQVEAAHPELRMKVIGDSAWPRARWGIAGGLLWDHHLFYGASIPGVTFFNDYHVDYQEATDTPDAIDAEKAARVVRLAFYLGQALANAPTRPTWTAAGQRAQADLAALSKREGGLDAIRGPWRHLAYNRYVGGERAYTNFLEEGWTVDEEGLPPKIEDDALAVEWNLGGSDTALSKARLRAWATATSTERAGWQLEDEYGSVYVPAQCVGTRRCPLVIDYYEARAMVSVADKYGFIISTAGRGFGARYTPGHILEKLLGKLAIDLDKIVLIGVSDAAAKVIAGMAKNLDVYSRGVMMVGPRPRTMGLMDPPNGKTEFYINHGILDYLPTLITAHQLRRAGHPVTVAFGVHGHGPGAETYDLAGQWLTESWALPKPATRPAPAAVPEVELTPEALGKLTAFWGEFMQLDSTIRTTARRAHQRRVAVPYADPEVRPVTQIMDLPALAAQFPSVAALLAKAGLTAEQHDTYRIALFSAYAAWAEWRNHRLAVLTTSVLGKNVAFIEDHPDELALLEQTGMWHTP